MRPDLIEYLEKAVFDIGIGNFYIGIFIDATTEQEKKEYAEFIAALEIVQSGINHLENILVKSTNVIIQKTK